MKDQEKSMVSIIVTHNNDGLRSKALSYDSLECLKRAYIALALI